MIDKLPVEIQVRLLGLVPNSNLRVVNKQFFMLYNELFYQKIIQCYGEAIIPVIIKVSPWLREYMQTLDVIREIPRLVLAKELQLLGQGNNKIKQSGEDKETYDLLNVEYIKDSWKYVYSLLKNKRLFAEYSDYRIDEPTNYVFNHYVEINRTYLLSYSKELWLAPGSYNLNIGLVIKHGNGLGTTKFEIRYKDDKGETIAQPLYAPSNINDILPKHQFCLLRLGEFIVPHTNSLDYASNRTVKVQLVMEEIGLYLKSGFRIYFIDIAQPSSLLNDFDLLYYSVKETDYRYFINVPLKNFYKALNYVQNGIGTKDSSYGSGDPNEIETFDHEWPIINNNGETKNSESPIEYGNFYFNHRFGRRYFKFCTIYQRRQFVNRFGDFESDWSQEEDTREGVITKSRSCIYDPQGLKWKMPILGEL